MYNIISNSGRAAYGIQHFVIDTYDDITDISTDILNMGSTVFVIKTSQYYMLNGEKTWVVVNLNTNNGAVVSIPGILDSGIGAE